MTLLTLLNGVSGPYPIYLRVLDGGGNGSGVTKPLKRWDGTQWVPVLNTKFNRWDGSSWQTT